MLKFFRKSKRSKVAQKPKALPYTHCLNCGTELQGEFCHKCGQEALNKIPTVGGIILEYINNAFIWDPKFFTTFWTLIRRPGKLTNDYNAGKFISQEHPLKLNMFLLFVFISLFVFFASGEKMTNSVRDITTDERVMSGIQFELLLDDKEYALKMQESPRDTILMRAPLLLAENYSDIITNIETKEKSEDGASDRWVAAVPHILIEDGYIIADDSGYYHIDSEVGDGKKTLDMFNSICSEMVDITSRYFPILLLLTVPFLTLSLRLVQRKSKIPRIHHFIFALHYTAFLEFLIICIYILVLTIAPPVQLLQYAMIAASCLYLAIAYHRVYATSWINAIVKSLLTSFIYFAILLAIFITIILVACFITVAEQI